MGGVVAPIVTACVAVAVHAPFDTVTVYVVAEPGETVTEGVVAEVLQL